MGSDKKERLVVSEQASNDAEKFNRREVWLTQLQKSLPIVNNMYGLNITAKLNEPKGVNYNAAVSRDTDEPAGEQA